MKEKSSLSITPEASAFLESKRELVLRTTKHPFLSHYRTYGLNHVATQFCFTELYQFFNHYPFYLAVLAGRQSDLSVLQEMIRILSDEVAAFEGTPHLDIYRDFLAKLDVTGRDLAAYQPLASSTAINAFIKKEYIEGHVATAIGALFGLETMASEMMTCLHEGLRTSGYDETVRYFFEIHVEIEKEHSDESFSAAVPLFAPNLSEEQIHTNKTRFEEGLTGFLTHLDAFWTNIGRGCFALSTTVGNEEEDVAAAE